MEVEATIAEVAARQHGVAARRQLLEAGVTPDAIDRRVKLERLRPVHRGVYLVGPVMPPNAREMAAVLACGSSAVLSHGSAAVLWGLLPRVNRTAPAEVIDRDGDHRKPGLRVYHIRTLRNDEVTRLDGIPITTPTRTLYDLAGRTRPRVLERALAEGFARRLTNAAQLRKVLTRHSGGAGTPALRALLEQGSPALTRSEAEERFLALVREAQLESPEVNVRVDGYEVDFYWREQRLVVEIDGRAFHASPGAFEGDRRRDAALTAAGLRVVRVTWRQLVNEPSAVLVRLAQALARTVSR